MEDHNILTAEVNNNEEREEIEENEGNGNLVDKISEAFARKEVIKEAGNISKVIAKAVWEEKEKRDRREEQTRIFETQWKEVGGFHICTPCQEHLTPSAIPNHLKTYHRGNFSAFKSSNPRLLKCMRGHARNPLHLWCHKQWKDHEHLEKKEEEDSLKAASQIIMNALLVLKGSISQK